MNDINDGPLIIFYNYKGQLHITEYRTVLQ